MDAVEATTISTFPSLDWFQALRDAYNNNDPERLKRLGTVDMVLVAKIDYPEHSRLFEITFAAYRCLSVVELRTLDAAHPDAVVLEGSFDAWCEMIENIKRNGAADLEHTLNALTLLDTPMRVESRNQLDTDLFYRYQESLQEFFDGSARVETNLTGQAYAAALN